MAELTAAAAAAQEPGLTPASSPRFGGVDPLGLRQLNFDLMDEVFPGLNNVARHIRPFVVVTWAWRHAHRLAQQGSTTLIKQEELIDFVDRVEVLYVASQLLNNPGADLPGSQYLLPLLREKTFVFSGPKWQEQRKARRYSTSLSAPINYGPGLKALGWVVPHHEHPRIMLPTPTVIPALDAFEIEIRHFLRHEAFCTLDPVTVGRDEARDWADAWSLDGASEQERRVMADLLFGSSAPVARRRGVELMLQAAQDVGDTSVARLRSAMSGAPDTFEPPSYLVDIRDAWRRVQVRQLFRLSLEAMFFWTTIHLESEPRSIERLVTAFLGEVRLSSSFATAGAWLASLADPTVGPTALMDELEEALANPEDPALARSSAAGLAFSLFDATDGESGSARTDRLPLSRARREADARRSATVAEFMRHILESWVLAQHAYWSVGRGLADARAGGRVLLRLRVILDEGGWTLTPGAARGNAPRPTPDRLQTAISLATECGLFS